MKIYVAGYENIVFADSYKGFWLDPSDYENKDEFINACYEKFNSDEVELRFTDWEDIPEVFISELSISEKFWDYVNLDDDKREILSAYFEYDDYLRDFDEIIDNFIGYYDDKASYAMEVLDDIIPKNLQNYFDYDGYADELEINDITSIDYKKGVAIFRKF